MPFLLTCALILQTGIVANAHTDPGWQRSFVEVMELEFRAADQKISYGAADEQFIDLWLPSNGGEAAAPVVVLIHGGCWLAQYDISHIRPLASAISDQGFAVWAIEYRRVGQPGGGWPGTFLDIARAVDLLAEFTHPLLDTRKIVFVGHSAGGQLALWAAGRSRLTGNQELYRDEPVQPMGAIGLAAITDLADYAAGDNSCQKVVNPLMGGDPKQVPDRYDQASPAELGSDVPLVLIQGGADRIVPGDQALALPEATTQLLSEAGHFDLIHTGTPAFPVLVSVLRDLFGL